MLGLDIGERRIGVAICDPEEHVATPLTVLDARVLRDVAPLARLIEEYDVARLVVGLPLSLDGTEGAQAARVRIAATRIAEATGLPVDFADERLSSAAARRAMTEGGVPDKAKRGRIDMAAASLFLQSYLDARHVTVERDRIDSEGADGEASDIG